ncbi:MAG TPA: hypothetical protein VM345_10480 [Acidimicrobiales bacterium]|jgi:hypothetical protein|nr:hypothetical protein [Acidimicrobiales bacterium]
MKILTALALVVAGTAHLAAAAQHRGATLAMSLFAVVAVGQSALAALHLRRGDGVVRAAVGITSLALIVLWAASRWTGVVIGHTHEPGAVGAVDATAVVAQLVALGAITKTSSGPARWTAAAGIATGAALLAVTLSSGPRAAGDTERHHHHGEEAAAASEHPA